jgi:hypothetical protein
LISSWFLLDPVESYAVHVDNKILKEVEREFGDFDFVREWVDRI